MQPTVAVLGDPIRLGSELEGFDHAEIVWAGQSVDAMMDALPELMPRVLVLQLEHLGRTPITRAQLLAALAGADLTIVSYTFASRDMLLALQDSGIQAVREPLTPEVLHAEMSRVVIRSARTGAPMMVEGRPVRHLQLVRSAAMGA